jgi:hypothetical protein
MTLTDGAIMFGFCLVSFIIGFLLGSFRVARLFNREFGKVSVELEKHRRGLEQFYSKLSEEQEGGQQ